MKILFLTYVNRSGSTFLANQLSKSPDICVCPEAEILYPMFLKNPFLEFSSDTKKFWIIINELERDKKFSLWNFNRVELFDQISASRNNLEIFIAILSFYSRKNKPTASIILYKNTQLIDLIAKIPEAVIKSYNMMWIALMRDIRSVYLSQSITISPFTGKPMCTNWYTLAMNWNSFINQTYEYSALNNFSRFKYEDLIMDTHMVVNNITAVLGVNFQLNWISDKKGEITEILSQDYRSIHPMINDIPDESKIHKWKQELPASKQDFLVYFCKKNLRRNGYSTDGYSLKLRPLYITEITRKKISHFAVIFKNYSKSIIKKWLKPAK